VTWPKFVECVSQWSSILGFILGVVTVFLAGTIRRAVSRTQMNAVFNKSGKEKLQKLKAANFDFLESVKSQNRTMLRSSLSSLRTSLEIALRSVPEEFKTKGKKTVKQIVNQYNSLFYWEDKRWYSFLLCQASFDDLMDTYNQVTDFIDNIDNFIEEKSITY
jgi:hypothetical protein